MTYIDFRMTHRIFNYLVAKRKHFFRVFQGRAATLNAGTIEVARCYYKVLHASRFFHHPLGELEEKGGKEPARRISAFFHLKFNARRTARVIGRDLFKRENYPEGVVEHRRFNSRPNGERMAGRGGGEDRTQKG